MRITCFVSAAAAFAVGAVAMPGAAPAAGAQEPAALAAPGEKAPPQTRVVTAEGRAVINPAKGGVPGARRAATALALRAAVEKAAGVYVAARTLTQNYQTLRDQVLTRSEGYATLQEVLKEEVGADSVRVVVRAEVSLKPLAEQLKALRLTRNFRVHVRPEAPKGAGQHAAAAADEAAAQMERSLAEAGFVVTENARDADVVVAVAPRFTVVHKRDLETAAGAMTMRTVRGDYTARATWSGTGEVVAALSASDQAMHIDMATACKQTAEDALATLAPRLADALMVLPARDAQPVKLTVANLGRASQVAKLEEALNTLPGVRSVVRRSFTAGRATWELEVFTDTVSMLPEALEESKPLRPFGLTVLEESRAKIAATAAAPRKASR